MLAGELADQGKADEGLAMAKGLLDNSANDRTVWLAMGQMDVRLRRWKDAEEAFNKASNLTPAKKIASISSSSRGSWPSGRSITNRPSSSSVKPLNSIPTTP